MVNIQDRDNLRTKDKISAPKLSSLRRFHCKKKRDKIGMGYESLHIMKLISVQCLQVDDVIPILPACSVLWFSKIRLVALLFGACIKSL